MYSSLYVSPANPLSFQANELQLQGPVPNELYHRYVEFKSFVRGMFTGEGLRGRILHKALHHQHERIYTYNESTKYGELDGPGRDMALQFLDMVHYDEGGRIFTYVITLDGLMRFTETGKEFGIDLLSKHTMHSDVNVSTNTGLQADIRYTSHAAASSSYGGYRIRESPPRTPTSTRTQRSTSRAVHQTTSHQKIQRYTN